MTIALRSWPRALALTLALVAGVGALVLAAPAQAQEVTGARANKDCPGLTATPGQTITCNFEVENTGALPATVTALREISPFPGGTPVNITCTAAGATISVGSTLAPGVDCTGTFQVTIPNDPTLCGTAVADRVEIALRYTDVLIADAGATGITLIVCPADITITKTADALSKVGDPVTYTFRICNVGAGVANRGTVTDTLLGNLTEFFPATLAPGPQNCVDVVRTRTVAAGDSDPLPNTVTAIYSSGASSDTATASASTNLFQPSVNVTKNCTPDPVVVGGDLTCTIVVTNTSSGDTPVLIDGTIDDTLAGDLLDPANTAVVSSTCTASLPGGGTCTIVTERTVLEADPNPLVNTVTVNYNPTGFPNDISDEASDSVVVKPKPPKGGEGCTPGYWKQDQHFDSWVEFEPGDFFEAVFGVEDVTVRAGGRSTIDNPTLLEALNATGGGVNALARHAVAALLNASNPDVESDFTVAEVIALVQEAFESGDFETAQRLLAAANEQGCPLN